MDFLLQYIYKPIGTCLVKTLQTITKKLYDLLTHNNIVIYICLYL